MQRQYKGGMQRAVTSVAVCMALYHVFFLTHTFERLGIYFLAVPHAAASLGFVLVLVFLLVPVSSKAPRDRLPWYDGVLAFLSMIPTGYIFIMGREMARHAALVEVLPCDLIMGTLMVLITLEAARRVMGLALPLIVTAFILHTMFCNYVPGLFHGRGYSWGDIVKQLFVWDAGIFGLPMQTAATIVIVFIIFAQLLQVSGAGRVFIDAAFALFGRFRGGPAKAAIFASALFGTISGSTSGNVASTGIVTIPMMKQVGYKPHFAGAVEAVASNGGQIMPPVMGAVAFIICEFLQIPYITVCLAAAIPAILYFLALFVVIHLEAVKLRISGLPRETLPSLLKTMQQGWHYLVPLLVLIYLLAVLMYEPQLAALYALAALVLITIIMDVKKSKEAAARESLNKIIHGLELGGRGMLEVSTACATAGMIIGCIGLSGLGQKLSMGLLYLSGGNLLLLLMLTAIAAFILGMGMTSIPIYILLATLIAPALTQRGIPPIAAHLFVFYWGLTSFITPPVCIAAFVAAAIAGSKPFQTGWTATRIGIATFILPFMFVYSPALVLQGTLGQILLATLIATIGIIALSASLAGYGLQPESWLERVLLVAGAVGLVFKSLETEIIGIGFIAIVVINQVRKIRVARLATATMPNDERRKREE